MRETNDKVRRYIMLSRTCATISYLSTPPSPSLSLSLSLSLSPSLSPYLAKVRSFSLLRFDVKHSASQKSVLIGAQLLTFRERQEDEQKE